MFLFSQSFNENFYFSSRVLFFRGSLSLPILFPCHLVLVSMVQRDLEVVRYFLHLFISRSHLCPHVSVPFPHKKPTFQIWSWALKSQLRG